jgi:Tfp pilus assembly protein PilV
MEGSMFPALAPVAKRVVPLVAALVIGVGGLGYATYEHHNAQNLANQNQQETAQLKATQGELTATNSQLNVLAAKVNDLEAAREKPSPDAYAPGSGQRRQTAARRRVRPRVNPYDARFRKLQSQVDAQGKEIDQTRSDLTSATTELGGSIAKTHDELVLMEKKGQQNYFEFDITKSRDFRREGPLSVRLRKANVKHQFADLMLIVDDRDVTQKHVNLYQPVMFYTPDSPRPVEVVINAITKNHIHGYVSAPKFRTSELDAMANGQSGAAATVATANKNGDPTLKQREPVTTVNEPAGVPVE